MASGRVVALGMILGLLGGLCLLLGAGPIITNAEASLRAAGLASLGAGGILLIGAWGLLRRPPWGRGAGVLAATVTFLLGLALTYAAADALVMGCWSTASSESAPACLFGSIFGIVGLAIAGLGFAGVRIVRRARGNYFGPRVDREQRGGSMNR